MVDSLMYQEDAFIVLESDQPEQILTPQELLEKLKLILSSCKDELPRELQKFDSIEEQATYLRENFCEFDVGSGSYFQWYVIRLEK